MQNIALQMYASSAALYSSNLEVRNFVQICAAKLRIVRRPRISRFLSPNKTEEHAEKMLGSSERTDLGRLASTATAVQLQQTCLGLEC
jgi:hypothetical protein